MKKAICILASIVLATVTGITTHASTPLNDNEQELIVQLKGYTYETQERIYSVSDDLLAQIESYLAKDNVDLSEKQCSDIVVYAKIGLSYMAEQGIENAASLNEEQIQYLLDNSLTKIGDELNLKVTYDAKNKKLNISEKETPPAPTEPDENDHSEDLEDKKDEAVKPNTKDETVIKKTASKPTSTLELVALFTILGSLVTYGCMKEKKHTI